MSTYKLYYFNSRGSGESIRIILAQAGVKYEDIRFEREQWIKEYKESKLMVLRLSFKKTLELFTQKRRLDVLQFWKLMAQC